MNLVQKILRKTHTVLFVESGRNKGVRLIRKFWLERLSPYKQNKAISYRLNDGRFFIVHPQDYLSKEIYFSRDYESLESNVIKHLILPGDLTIDIGANIGFYTALMSYLVGSTGKVYAFEPAKKTFNKLEKTVELLNLSNVESFCLGLGEDKVQALFNSSVSGHDAQQSMRKWIGMDWVGGKYTMEQVQLISLDEFLDEHFINTENISFIKCDVEGFEFSVLKGSKCLLECANPPILQVEINQPALVANDIQIYQILQLLGNYSMYYTPLALSPGVDKQTLLKKLPTSIDKLPEICNLFAFPVNGIYSNRIAFLQARKQLIN